MPELTSLVLTVAPTVPTTTPAHLGRAAYALLLRLIAEDDPDLAQAIHDSDQRKPFTCSTLVGGERQGKGERVYRPEKPAWLRFTGLNAALSAQLTRLAQEPPDQVELDGFPFRVHESTLAPEQHKWAQCTSYEDLAAPYLLARRDPDYRLNLAFRSPTTFRSNGRSHPVPMADWVFGNLLDFWNMFSPIPLAEQVRQYAIENLVLSRYRLKTRAVPLKARVVQMGCVGQASYVILDRDRYWAATLNLLADYAFYSGIGYQTTAGLGQARRA